MMIIKYSVKISASLEEGREAGLIEENEHQMVQNVFHLDDRPLTSLMVPRADVHWLDADMTVAQALVAAATLASATSAACLAALFRPS